MNDKGFWRGKNVFVTGATGLLGSWLVEDMLGRGANVVALVRDTVPKSYLALSGNIKKINIVHGELEDYFTVERSLNEYEIDSVFHLGAQTIVGTANRSPLSTFESNIKGTWCVLEAARVSKLVKRVIVASSDKAYGTQESLPYKEDAPLIGRHPYDCSKSCADLLAQAYAETYNMPVAVTRCGNLFGGGDLNFNRIVPGTIRSIFHGEAPIIRSDGTYIRDYFFVKDAVKAYIALAEMVGEQGGGKVKNGEAFNFSSERRITVLELVNLLLKLMKSNLKPVILNEVKSEIKHQYLDSAKAKTQLNWKPLWTLEESLQQTIEWYVDFFKGSGK